MDINPPSHPAPRYRYRTFPLNVTASSERDSGWWERGQAEEDPPVTQQLHNINFQDPTPSASPIRALQVWAA